MDCNARILISGAGIAGLGCAAWLHKKGFSPVIVEKAGSVRAGGYLVSVSHHAYHLVEALGLLPELKKRDTGIRRSSYHDVSGRNLLSLDYQNLFEKVDVSRYIQFCSTYALYFQLCAISVFWYKFKIVQSKT